MIRSWLEQVQTSKKTSAKGQLTGTLVLMGERDEKKVASLIEAHALGWQKKKIAASGKELIHFMGQKGPVWILRARSAPGAVSHGGLLEESSYSFFRDQAGSLLASIKAQSTDVLDVECLETSREQELGFLVGLELAAYQFREVQSGKQFAGLPRVQWKKGRGGFDSETLKEAIARGLAINLARHLVNLPPNELHPESYPRFLKAMKWPKGMSLEVWDHKRLEKEKMGLHLAVGQGAPHLPCLVRLKWRPGKKTSKKPLAFVGKGITFDTGGLDIKPSGPMRLMKKDMGGSAAVAGLAWWTAQVNYPGPLDFYLALAENSVDAHSFRPSDLIQARNGAVVEIDNTDAEGRLVLADALDVAVTQKGADEPAAVINVATLTGAIKVALGAEVAGLFSNEDGLSHELQIAGRQAGDLSWRMPLVEKYWGNLSSPFADFKNSADGFGGAITAALFLSRFVRQKPWAHLDIYAWADRASGALLSSGGSGQGVQALIEFLENRRSAKGE